MITLLILFIIAVPLFLWVGKDMRYGQELFYQVAGGSLVLANLLFFDRKVIQKNKLSLWIGIFGIYSILLFLLGGCKIGVSTLINIIIGCLLYFITLSIDRKYTHLVFKTIIVVCVINAIYMFLQSIGFDFIYVLRGSYPDAKDLIGLFGLKAHMGIYTALGMIATLFVNPWLALGWLPALYISRSIGAIAGAGLGAIFYFWWVKRKVAWMLIPLALISTLGYSIFIDAPMGTIKTRPGLWKMAMKDVVYGFSLHNPDLQSPFLKNALTGFGLEAFLNGNIFYFNEPLTEKSIRGILFQNKLYAIDGRQFTVKDGEVFSPDGVMMDRWDNPHNILVSLFYDWGLIGILIVGFCLFYMKELFKNSIKSGELVTITAMLIVLIISSLTQFPFYVARIGYTFPVLLGLLVNNSED